MRYNGAGLGPTWPGVNKVASEEGVVLDDKVMLSKGSTNVKKDAFFDYLVLGGSGRVRDKEKAPLRSSRLRLPRLKLATKTRLAWRQRTSALDC